MNSEAMVVPGGDGAHQGGVALKPCVYIGGRLLFLGLPLLQH